MDPTLIAKIPQHLLDLMESGRATLSVPDGAIRYLKSSGKHPGSIAGYLKPANMSKLAELAKGGASIAANVAAVASVVGAAAAIVNIGVSIAGFFMIAKMLRRIEKQIEQLSNQISEVQRKLGAMDERLQRQTRMLGELSQWLQRDRVIRLCSQIAAEVEWLDPRAAIDSTDVSRKLSKLSEVWHIADRCCDEAIKLGQPDFAQQYVGILFSAASAISHVLSLAGRGGKAVEFLDKHERVHEKRARQAAGLFLSARPSLHVLCAEPGEEPMLEQALWVACPDIPYGGRISIATERYRWPSEAPGRTRSFGNLGVSLDVVENGPAISVPDLVSDELYTHFQRSRARQLTAATQTVSALHALKLQKEILEVDPDAARHEQEEPADAPLEFVELT